MPTADRIKNSTAFPITARVQIDAGDKVNFFLSDIMKNEVISWELAPSSTKDVWAFFRLFEGQSIKFDKACQYEVLCDSFYTATVTT